MKKWWMRGWCGVLACGVAAAAAGSDSKLIAQLPAEATAVYYLDAERILALPVADRLLAWPEIRELLELYLPGDGLEELQTLIGTALIGFNTEFTGAQPAVAVLLETRDATAWRQIARRIPELRPDATATTLPTWRNDELPLTLQKRSDEVVLLAINDRDDLLLNSVGRGVSSSEVRRLLAEQPDQLAWFVVAQPGMLSPSDGAVPSGNPLENVLRNIRSITGNLGESGTGLSLQVTAYCTDNNVAQMLAMQTQMMLTFGVGMVLKDDRALGNELIQALQVTPQGNQVDCTVRLTAPQVDRLLDCLESSLEKSRARAAARAQRRQEQLATPAAP